jgi:Zn-dependent protease
MIPGVLLMRSWSVSAGRVFGIDVRVHLTFVFLLFYVWMTEASGLGAAGVGRGLALVGLVLASVLLHEFAHMLAALQQRLPASSVVLLPLYTPMVVAKLTSVLDVASDGRYHMGIGVGGEFPKEFEACGVPVNQRG